MSIITTSKHSGKYQASIKIPDTFPNIQQKNHFSIGGYSTSTEAKNQVEMRLLLNLYNKDRNAFITFTSGIPTDDIFHIHYDEGWVIDHITGNKDTPSRECMQLADAYDYYNQESLFLDTCRYALKKLTLKGLYHLQIKPRYVRIALAAAVKEKLETKGKPCANSGTTGNVVGA